MIEPNMKEVIKVIAKLEKVISGDLGWKRR
ncbi:hypothetical protein SAMN05216179_2361 [Gracilibacillus kekensis]|uniref:Uncharacterized protein n=1 Tax=Gracilibacillus kekensis TaxID=1027249 RepID=A0A1M7PMZ1_9BACI|nr:hypothetical protein SAMN05216179_2361 [Gracilibacillus kekensis]